MGVVVLLVSSFGAAQVFPPRQPQPAPAVPNSSMQSPQLTPQQFNGPSGTMTNSIPVISILGDPTKSFIQLSNMRSPFDSNFSFGRGLTGRISMERYTYEAGNGQKVFVHLSGVSNPPIANVEEAEVRFQYLFPSIQFKTYYKDYSGDGDAALSDLVAQNVLVDVFISPTIDQRRLPTYHSVRIAITGSVKEADKCTFFFDIIFPVNICKIVDEYFGQVRPALESSIREIILQPQTRTQFEQQVSQFVRTELLRKAGINPMSAAQIEIVQAEFRGTDYVVSYLPR